MTSSKRIAGLVGPTIVAMIVSEFPLVQPHLYDAQIPPVVYLSGVLMFVAGLARSNRGGRASLHNVIPSMQSRGPMGSPRRGAAGP